MDVREKLEVIAHLGDHISYKEDIGICYDSELAKVIEDAYMTRKKAYMTLKNGVTVQKWIPVTERLPQSGKCVLVYSKSGGVAEGCYSAYDKKWVQFRWSVKDLEVTHWMPLPSTEGLE